MAEQRKTKSIGLYVIISQSEWKYLPKTSDYLNELQELPSMGDWIGVLKSDWPLMGIDPEHSYRSVLVVDFRIFSYGFYDIAVVCRFREFESSDQLPANWQKIPLN